MSRMTSAMEVVGLSAVGVGLWLVDPWLLLAAGGAVLTAAGWWLGR
jgi:hypothetical protein